MDDLPPLGPPGREVSRERIADLDVDHRPLRQRLEPGLQADRLTRRAASTSRFASARGMAGLPADRKSLAWLGPLLGSTGVGPLDLDGLERLLTGRRMSMSFGIDEDALVLRGSTRAEELGDQLRLLATKIVAPHFDPALFQRSKIAALESYELAFSSAAARMGREFGAVARGGDPRWQPFDKAEIERLRARGFRGLHEAAAGAGAGRGGGRRRRRSRDGGGGDAEDGGGAAARAPEVRPPAASLKVRPPRASKEPIRFTHQGDPTQAYAALGWTTFGGPRAAARAAGAGHRRQHRPGAADGAAARQRGRELFARRHRPVLARIPRMGLLLRRLRDPARAGGPVLPARPGDRRRPRRGARPRPTNGSARSIRW